MEHESCYIFTPSSSQRPSKRQKVSSNIPGRDKSETIPVTGFEPLLDGHEDALSIRLRYHIFEQCWSREQDLINNVIDNANDETLDDLVSFIKNVAWARNNAKIPTALVEAGPNLASHELLFQRLSERALGETGHPQLVVVLKSAEALSLRAILKKIIKDSTSKLDPLDQTSSSLSIRKEQLNFLSYDLGKLHHYAKVFRIQKIVVVLQDSEAFDSQILSELIQLLHSWLDRIPFILVFGIATSVEIFQDRLPRVAVKLLRGQTFHVEKPEKVLEELFQKVIIPSSITPRLGASVISMLLERQTDHVQSIRSLTKSIKVSFPHIMSGWMINMITIDNIPAKFRPSLHEVVRNLYSFRSLVEQILTSGDTKRARLLLEDDDYLHREISKSIEEGQAILKGMVSAVNIVHVCRSCISGGTNVQKSELYIKSLSGELIDSIAVRELLLSIKKMSSDTLALLLDTLLNKFTGNNDPVKLKLLAIKAELSNLTKKSDTSATPLRNQHNFRFQSLRTTVVAQRVELSRQNFTEQDMEYSKLATRTHDLLDTYLKKALIDPKQLFLYEALLYELKSPLREVFVPKSRFSIERALSTPQDFLGCNCCFATEEGLSSSQPPTAILYQLYLESGALINLFDLWSAFFTIVGGIDGEDCDLQNALALFYRALADLKYLGMVKHSRKKVDHLSKLAWKGL
ncbi:MAG: hypothetical protein M1829_006314 [Trizodia sp. TS-e1964]|nr:MAG: hypothetical protein M1829_006314 [Trizodia sp. TS-e1964]